MKNFECKSCGKVTVGGDNLCDPVEVEAIYECKTCGDHISNPKDLSTVEPVEFKFFCNDCGRGSATQDGVCEPSPIA